MTAAAIGAVLGGIAALVGIFRGARSRVVLQGHVGFKLRGGKPCRHRLRYSRWGEVKHIDPGLRVFIIPFVHRLEQVDIRDRPYKSDMISVTLLDGSSYRCRVEGGWKIRREGAFSAHFEIDGLSDRVATVFAGAVQVCVPPQEASTFNADVVNAALRKYVQDELYEWCIDVTCCALTEREGQVETRWATVQPLIVAHRAKGLVDARGVLHDNNDPLTSAEMLALTAGPTFTVPLESPSEAAQTAEEVVEETDGVVTPLRVAK